MRKRLSALINSLHTQVIKMPLTYLGEIFYVTEEYEDIVDAVITKGSSLSQGQRLYFESADFEVNGSNILERHVITSPDGVPNRLRLDNIQMRHRSITAEQAQAYKDYMLRSGFTYSAAISEMDNKMKKEGYQSTLSWLESICYEMEACDVGPDDALHSSNQEEAIPATYGFHKIGDMYDTDYEIPWILRQPNLVQRLITTPERCKNLTQLRNLGKGCYEAQKEKKPADYQQAYLSMTNSQKSVFWDAYNKRKRKLMESIELSHTAKALVNRIYKARKPELPRLKANLVRLQKGQIKVKEPPSDEEWEVVWWWYGKRQY